MQDNRKLLPEGSQPWDVILPFVGRVLIWLLLFLVLYLLRSFFTLIFLTFVFAYIQETIVNKSQSLVASRTTRVVAVASCLLGCLILIGLVLVPRVKEEAEIFATRLPSYIQALDKEIYALRERHPTLEQILPAPENSWDHIFDVGGKDFDLSNSPSALLAQQLISAGDDGGTKSALDFKTVVTFLGSIGSGAVAVGSAFLLALLFSFLIVFDLPRLSQTARQLEFSRLSFFYREASGTIVHFCRVLGKALEAQLVISLINTVLTAIGLIALGLVEKVTFLSLIVFLCGFIPVAGVFISSIPIGLVALQEGGGVLVAFALTLIVAVHLVEAYILNPRIYGKHLKINPVVVLIILTIAGKLFHAWGLILGVPICTYVFGHAIWADGDAHAPTASGEEPIQDQI